MNKLNITLITRRIQAMILGLILLFFSTNSLADLVVVVHPNNPNDELSRQTVINLFMGKSRQFPDGSDAVPFDLDRGTDARLAFISKLLKRTEAQVKAYWSRLVFTGRGKPPKSVEDEEELIEIVSTNPKAIGYLKQEYVTGQLKIVFTIPE